VIEEDFWVLIVFEVLGIFVFILLSMVNSVTNSIL
jgi:hypothetical protein